MRPRPQETRPRPQGRRPRLWEMWPRPRERRPHPRERPHDLAQGRHAPPPGRHIPPPGDKAGQEVGVRQSTGMASHQLPGSPPALGTISCLRTRDSPPHPFVTAVTQGPGDTQASGNTPCPLPSRKEARGGQDSVTPWDRRCPWGWDSSKSRATRSRHSPLPGSGRQCPWEPLPWEAWAVPLCTCASHKCLLGRGDLGLSGSRVPCPSPESSVWELVRSLPTGGQSCGRSAQGAVQRNQSIPTWALLRCQWDFPGKNTGVGCHFLLQRSREYCLLKSMLNHIHMAADHYDSVCESSPTLRPRRL